MTKKQIGTIALTLAALVWGIAFVAQSVGSDYIMPYTFNAFRYFIGTAVLTPMIPLLDKVGATSHLPQTKEDKKLLLRGGLQMGFFLFLASTCQQLGLYMGVPSGKAGFLTACYIVLVPVAGIFLGKKCPKRVWAAVGVTVVGLYLLCMKEKSFSVQPMDAIILLSALFYCLQIVSIDHYVASSDAVRLAWLQFMVSGILGLIPAFFMEFLPDPAAWCAMFTIPQGWVALLYVGIMSTAVGYTLQCVGQKDVPPALASLLMSFESVFAVLAGWLILGDMLSLRELAGCALIFGAVILAQL